jgi:hypothetical protein
LKSLNLPPILEACPLRPLLPAVIGTAMLSKLHVLPELLLDPGDSLLHMQLLSCVSLSLDDF